MSFQFKKWGWGLVFGASLIVNTQAAEWSDTSIALSYGQDFSEPFKNNGSEKSGTR